MIDSSSTDTERISCSDIALFFDNEVSVSLCAEKQRAVSVHLSRCPECNAFVKLASNLARFSGRLSENELNLGIQKVMNQARQQGKVERNRMPRWAVVAFAASLAALTLIGAFHLFPFSAEPSQETESFQCVSAVPTEPVNGVFITYCDHGKKPETILGTAGDVKISLRSGTVGLLIDLYRPDKKQVVVETPHGTVRVKGTVFTVDVDHENTWVEVFRGVVEIVSKVGDGAVLKVTEGHGADLVSGKSAVLSAPKTDMLWARLSAAAQSGHSDGPGGSGEMPKELSPNKASEPTETDAPQDSEGTIAQGDRGITEAHRGSGGMQRPAIGSMYDLIQEAQACLIDRDWACAAARYRTVLEHYPRRPETMAVLISLAKVELRYLRAPRDALAHFKSYQRRAPNGPLAEEALFGIAEAYQRLGQKDAETETLRQFIERFPESSMIQKARARLRQLEA